MSISHEPQPPLEPARPAPVGATGYRAAMEGMRPLPETFWRYWALPFAIMAGLFIALLILTNQLQNPHYAEVKSWLTDKGETEFDRTYDEKFTQMIGPDWRGHFKREEETRLRRVLGLRDEINFREFAVNYTLLPPGGGVLILLLLGVALLMGLHSLIMAVAMIRATRRMTASSEKSASPPVSRGASFLYSVALVMFGGFFSFFALTAASLIYLYATGYI